MSLHIESEETCRLADELSRITGETMADAINLALQERLARERRQHNVEERLRRIHAVAKRCAALPHGGSPPVDHSELLYDERGLPK